MPNEPKTYPHAADYRGPWNPERETRCADCGTARGNVYYSTTWGEHVCSSCAASRLGA